MHAMPFPPSAAALDPCTASELSAAPPEPLSSPRTRTCFVSVPVGRLNPCSGKKSTKNNGRRKKRHMEKLRLAAMILSPPPPVVS